MTKFDVDTDLIRRLAELLEETGLTEIELGDGDRRVRVARAGGKPSSSEFQENPGAAAAAAPAAPQAVDASHPGAVTSPMVGTVYVAPEPGAPAFVSVGDTVDEGKTLFIIEAMKVLNPIRAPRAGKVTRILVKDGEPIEYGEVLLILE